MKIGLISLISPIHNGERIEKSLEDYRKKLVENFQVQEIQPEELLEGRVDPEDFDLTPVFVKSGGTENLFVRIYEQLTGPVFLLSTPLHNSLAASMEILTWVKARGGGGKIIYGNLEEIVREIGDLVKINKTAKKLKNLRLGVIGEPSDWLIASGVKGDKIKETLGIELVDVDLEKVRKLFFRVSAKKAQEIATSFLKGAQGMKECAEADLEKAARVYLALKEIVTEEGLSALTIRCFDLLQDPASTGCLALSLLNNEGIVAGCEGDVPATVSMYLAHHLTGELPFMANPNEIDPYEQTIKFAHCTLPTGMVESFIIRSHFESGMGVGIQGIIPEGPVTVFKLGGAALDKYALFSGEIVKNLDNPHACRTQILVRLRGAIDYFLSNPLGNHHIIIPDNHTELFKGFFELGFCQ